MQVEELSRHTGLAPATLRMYAYKKRIPVRKVAGRLDFDLAAVLQALGRTEATLTPTPAPKSVEVAAGLVLWNKKVARLGWAIGQVVDVDIADDFAEVLTDAGTRVPMLHSRLLHDVADGTVFVLEPGAVVELVLCQLMRTADAPQAALDALETARQALDRWKETKC